MARLNLICNGMMLFNATNDGNVQIIIPAIVGHRRGYCTAPNPAQDQVRNLATGSFRLNGPVSSGLKLSALLGPDRYLATSDCDRPHASTRNCRDNWARGTRVST